jgi:hypothetical protein
MRDAKRRNRRLTEPVFELDIIVPGLGSLTGKGDRFRCSAETRDSVELRERRRMIRDLGRRLLHEVLAARMAGRFTTEQLALAYKQGDAALRSLLADSRNKPLSELRDRWIQVCTARNRNDYIRQVNSFINYCGGESSATIADLTTEKMAAWLNGLTDQRRGRAGVPIRSHSKVAIESRIARTRKKRPLRPVSAATRNRHRTAMSAFCTFLVNVAGAIAVHPIRDRRLRAKQEAPGRMPDLDAEEWKRYCGLLDADLLAPPASVLIARILRHTGADVGEVLGHQPRSGDGWVAGLLVRDIHANRRLPRLRLKRQKVDGSPERLVPFPKRYLPELEAHVSAYDLGKNDAVFKMVDRSAFEAAHRRARNGIGHPELRLKDFRHLAAISWARAGVRIERVKDWLGHSDIRLTEIYSRFAPDDTFDEPAVERAAEVADGIADDGIVGTIGLNDGQRTAS